MDNDLSLYGLMVGAIVISLLFHAFTASFWRGSILSAVAIGGLNFINLTVKNPEWHWETWLYFFDPTTWVIPFYGFFWIFVYSLPLTLLCGIPFVLYRKAKQG